MNAASAERPLVPPDGGWGWVVCFAYAMNNVIVLPLISGFGLIFQKRFKEINISATETSVILIVNYAFGMLLSLFNGPLLKRFGYRKMAIIGSIFVAIGVMLTSLANSFASYLITYSIITSIGVALVMAAFTLAINSYFNKNRGKAVGLGMSITGLGPILMPQFMYLLIEGFGVHGAILILGAVSLHSLVASLLLRPIRWYLKPTEIIIELKDVSQGDTGKREIEQNGPNVADQTIIVPLKDIYKSTEEFSEDENEYLENANKMSTISLKGSVESVGPAKHREVYPVNGIVHAATIAQFERWDSQDHNLVSRKSHNQSNDSINRRARDKEIIKDDNNIPEEISLLENSIMQLEIENESLAEAQTQPKAKKTFGQKIVDFFDLTLLKDPIFVNILIGISIAGSAEINFTLLIPFILNDLNFKTNEIAAFMSVMAFADIIFRFISPFIGDWCHRPPRIMYLTSLIFLMFTRFSLFLATTYNAMIAVALALGIAKGVRTVYMNLVIPSYVPIERLAFASGILMPVNGLVLLSFGPILGLIRDKSGSYSIPIVSINCVTFITVILWSTEFIYLRIKEKKETRVNV